LLSSFKCVLCVYSSYYLFSISGKKNSIRLYICLSELCEKGQNEAHIFKSEIKRENPNAQIWISRLLLT